MYVKLRIFLLFGLLVICEVLSQNRLSNATYPINYNVWLNFTDPLKQIFYGIVTIEIGVKMDTKQIQLNDLGTVIDQVVLSEKNKSVEIPIVLSNGTETKIIELASEGKLLEAGKLYKIKVNYSGYFWLLAGTNNWEAPDSGDFVVASNVFPFNVQYFIPCYDEPHLKATFEISILHDLGTTAVSNMAAESIVSGEGYLLTTFTKTPPLSTYSVAFAISNYGRVQNDGFKTINAFYGNLYQPSDVEFVLNVNQKVVELLVKYLNVQLDVNEINLVPIYEHPTQTFGTLGLLVNRHSYYYYNADTIYTTLDQDNIVRYVSQFYGNQYFGSLISPEWWPQIWFNLGVSKLLEYTISSGIYPDSQQMDLYFYRILTRANTSAGSAIEPNIETRLDILNHLNAEPSWKATALIYMIRNLLTERVYKLGLSQIIKERAYVPSNTKHIFDILTRVAIENGVLTEQQDLHKIFHGWITSEDLPSLNVNRDYKTGSVTITQTAVDRSSSIWAVPYNYMTQTNTTNWNVTTPDGWLENVSSVVLDLCAELKSTDWIIFNREFSAFYQTNYDTTNWLLLAKQLRRDHEKIPRHTRGQLMHNAYAFWLSGAMPYNIIFYFFSYLHQETNPVPFQPFLLYVRDKDPEFYYTKIYAHFTKFVINQLRPVYHRVRITDPSAKQNLSIFDEINQDEVLKYLCRMNYQPCLEDAQTLLNVYLETEKIDSSDEILVYGFVLSNENQFWEVFRRVNNVANRDKKLLNMLGLTQNSLNIEHILNILLTKNGEEYQNVKINLEVDDRVRIFETLQINNLAAVDLVYDVVENKSQILKEILGDEFHWIISNLVLHVSTEQKYEQILRIVPLYRTVGRDFEMHIELAKSKLRTITNLIELTEEVLAYLLENEVDPENKERDGTDVQCENNSDGNDNQDDDDGGSSALAVSGLMIILLNSVVIFFN